MVEFPFDERVHRPTGSAGAEALWSHSVSIPTTSTSVYDDSCKDPLNHPQTMCSSLPHAHTNSGTLNDRLERVRYDCWFGGICIVAVSLFLFHFVLAGGLACYCGGLLKQ